MKRPSFLLLTLLLPLAAVQAQDVFRCTDLHGRVTYQQARCSSTDDERKIDASPANPDYDPSARDRVLKQEEDLDRRLEARAAADRAERKEREERDARERLVAAQEQRAKAVEQPVYVLPGWPRFARRPGEPPASLSMSRRQSQDNRP
jgi:hypothetical protein